MQKSKRHASMLCLLLTLGLVLAMPGSALAQVQLPTTVRTTAAGTFTINVVIPVGTAPGLYDIVATGRAPVGFYPPSSSTSVSVSVSRNVVVAGTTVLVSGSGWSPNVDISLSLVLVNLTEATFSLAQATEIRTARARILVVAPGFITDPGRGPGFIIIGGGTTPQGDRPIIINNNNTNNNNNAASAAASAGGAAVTAAAATTPAGSVARGLARTGIPVLPLLAVAIATILLGTVLVNAGRRRMANQGSIAAG